MSADKDELIWAETTEKGVRVHLKVNPGCGSSSFDPSGDKYLKMNVKSPPEKGKANQEVLEVFNELLKGIECGFSIVRGKRSRRKILFIGGEPKTVLKTLKHIK